MNPIISLRFYNGKLQYLKVIRDYVPKMSDWIDVPVVQDPKELEKEEFNIDLWTKKYGPGGC